MDNEQKLLAMRITANQYLKSSKEFLRWIIPNRLIVDLEDWLPNRRLIDPAISIINAMCDLEGKKYNKHKFKISVLAGSAAAISDDIIDSRFDISYKKIKLLEDYGEIKESGKLGLFYAFNSNLLNILPTDFKEKYKNIIYEYNRAQEDSVRLFNPSIKREEIMNIKDRTGGYSVLLLYAMITHCENIMCGKKYYYQRVPITKQESLFNYGAWLSRVDDLWDAIKDNAREMKQLATEDIVTWDNLPNETLRMEEGLETHFHKQKVKYMMETHYAHLIDRNIFLKYGNR